ncbi:uncharacterized protein EV420DRAFT_1518209 [Desarmillaria tabescens]|uniref:F-box domain-containing protein n=1 Tax=Armillaria tabescens TaxID=1929756 RepID=A0AA39TVR8_ARMTA|nr:uncharacterized protein EV420DRAFT_1518209 [Desarmillaria tabescens]KAK0464789.1 hypothetical protein EV420DRAFT_1518209 [Desarmillaria tabescens]
MPLVSVSDILGTNHAPNEHDCVVIQKSLSEQEQLLEQVRTQKADLEEQLLVTSQREAQLVKSIADHRTLLRASPIRSLPAELLGEVFLAHCAQYPNLDSGRHDGVAFRKSRLRLLWVCRRWRDVALSIPRIWAVLSVEYHAFNRPHSEEAAAWASVLKRWISSSGHLPLSINFTFTESWDSHYHSDYQNIAFNAIFSQLHRCKCFIGRLEFDFNGHDAVHRALDQNIPDAPILETLSLRSYRSSSASPIINWRRKLYATIPRLRHLDVDSASGIVSLPVQNIITVKLETAALSDLFYLVENAAVLEELEVGEVEQSRDLRHSQRDAHRLDSLVNVHFRHTDSAAVSRFIDYVTLPSISELAVRTSSPWSDPAASWPDIDIFIRFFERSACSLTKLIIAAPEVDERGFLLGILPSVPSLQVLHIENEDYDVPLLLPSSVIEYLTGKPKRQNLTALTDLRISVQLRQMTGVKKLLDYRHTNWGTLGVTRLSCFSVIVVAARLSTAQMKSRRQQMREVFSPYQKAGLSLAWRIQSR